MSQQADQERRGPHRGEGHQDQGKEVAKYLGCQFCIDGSTKAEVEARLAKAKSAHYRLTPKVWRSRVLSLGLKKRLWDALAFSAMAYAMETQTLAGEGAGLRGTAASASGTRREEKGQA